MDLLITIFEWALGYILIGLVVAITTMVFHRKTVEEEIARRFTPEMRALSDSPESHDTLWFGLWFGSIMTMTPQWPYLVYLTIYSAFTREARRKE